MSLRVTYPLLCALAGALLLYLLAPAPRPPRPELRVVHVTPRQFEQLEPDTVVRFVERLVRPPAELEQRVISPGAGRARLDEFVAAALAHDSARNNPGPMETPRRLSYSYAGEFDGRRLELFNIVSDGAKERITYNACGRVTWVMLGDSAIVQGSRLCWLPDAAGLGGAAALGFGIAEGDWRIMGGGLVLLGVRKLLQ